jgi:hypothetical protein
MDSKRLFGSSGVGVSKNAGSDEQRVPFFRMISTCDFTSRQLTIIYWLLWKRALKIRNDSYVPLLKDGYCCAETPFTSSEAWVGWLFRLRSVAINSKLGI